MLASSITEYAQLTIWLSSVDTLACITNRARKPNEDMEATLARCQHVFSQKVSKGHRPMLQ